MLDKKEMVKNMINSFAGGRSALAAAIGMTDTAFNNRLYEKNGCRFFEIDDLEAMQDLTKTTFVADYFAQKADCVTVKKADLENGIGSFDLFQASTDIGVARGKYEAYLQKAIADGKIDPHEEEILNNFCEDIVKARLYLNKLVIISHKKAR